MNRNEPQRREQRITHLDASIVHVERALLARAEVLEHTVVLDVEGFDPFDTAQSKFAAREFRALAEELHWW